MKVVYNTCFGGFSISKECAQYMANRGNKECMELLARSAEDKHDEPGGDDLWFSGGLYDTPRHDAILVMAVEHLGSERASGDSAALEVHELTNDRYYIDEYDGTETVIEPHTISWIAI